MPVILLSDGGWHEVDEQMARTVQAAMAAKARQITLDPGHPLPTVLKLSKVTEVMDDAKWEIRQHQKRGDRQCMAGYWHGKNEQCAHTVPAMPKEHRVDTPNGPKVFRPMADWKFEILRLNAKRLSSASPGSKVGLLKTEEELAHYKLTDEWPPYLPVDQWHTVDPMYAKR